jgi:hypothetical protein
MSRSEQLIRVISAFAATLIAVLFVMGYNEVKYHNHIEHEHMVLPMVTGWIEDVVVVDLEDVVVEGDVDASTDFAADRDLTGVEQLELILGPGVGPAGGAGNDAEDEDG